MEWNWLHSILYGAIGGFFEFLPVPPNAQQELMMRLSGATEGAASLTPAVYLGCLLAVFFIFYSHIAKIRREKRIAAIPARRRKRQPDAISLMEWKLLRMGMIPLIISVILMPLLAGYFKRVWVLAIILCINGALILLPQYLSGSNKDARSLSPLDALLIGLSGILGVIPGISRVAAMTACAKMRGADQQFTIDFTYLLLIPALVAACLTEFVILVLGGTSLFTGWMFLHGLLAVVSSAASAFAGITLMRFLAVKIGFSGFAYYSIGVGMFTFILYLIG